MPVDQRVIPHVQLAFERSGVRRLDQRQRRDDIEAELLESLVIVVDILHVHEDDASKLRRADSDR
ncbi:hypothetical protein D3C76_1791900 [compost metagenome]